MTRVKTETGKKSNRRGVRKRKGGRLKKEGYVVNGRRGKMMILSWEQNHVARARKNRVSPDYLSFRFTKKQLEDGDFSDSRYDALDIGKMAIIMYTSYRYVQ